MIPIPPARAIVIARACSVTVSMGALTMGNFNAKCRESRVAVSTSFRERTADLLGLSNTSSKVNPSAISFEDIAVHTAKSVGEKQKSGSTGVYVLGD
jgi:hypothetical protein